MSTSPFALVRMACVVSLSRSVPVKRLSTAPPNRRPSTVDVMPRPFRTKRLSPTDRSSSLINRVTLGWDSASASVLAASVIEPVRRVARKASSCFRFISRELYKKQIYCRSKCICQIYGNHRYWLVSGNRTVLKFRWPQRSASTVCQHPKRWRFLSGLPVGKLYAVF